MLRDISNAKHFIKRRKIECSPRDIINQENITHPRGEKLYHIRKKGAQEIPGDYCKNNSWGYQLYRYYGETD